MIAARRQRQDARRPHRVIERGRSGPAYRGCRQDSGRRRRDRRSAPSRRAAPLSPRSGPDHRRTGRATGAARGAGRAGWWCRHPRARRSAPICTSARRGSSRRDVRQPHEGGNTGVARQIEARNRAEESGIHASLTPAVLSRRCRSPGACAVRKAACRCRSAAFPAQPIVPPAPFASSDSTARDSMPPASVRASNPFCCRMRAA